jgi:cell wall-associated NlpC family hydrolase
MGWDVASTTYPYQLQMSIDEDISGIKKKEMEAAALLKLYKGVGYNPHVHGGDAGAFNKLVKTVLKSSQTVGGSGGGGGGGTVDLSGGSFGEAALRVALPFKGGQYLLGGFDAPGGGTISGGVGDAAQGTTDCSGLTEYAYRRGAGLEIGSTANCQYRSAQASNVFFNDRAKLQTGDLMFYNFGGSASCADHVALWVSNARGGTIFHAHSSSSPIEYSYNYGWSSWMGAARPADGFKIVGGCVCR